jgi:hypothetical protein
VMIFDRFPWFHANLRAAEPNVPWLPESSRFWCVYTLSFCLIEKSFKPSDRHFTHGMKSVTLRLNITWRRNEVVAKYLQQTITIEVQIVCWPQIVLLL